MIRYMLVWYRENKFYTVILAVILMIITYVALILSHYFYYACTWESNDDELKNIFYFSIDGEADIETVESFFSSMSNFSDFDIITEVVAYGEGENNLHLYATDLLSCSSKESCIITWGKYPQKNSEVMQFNSSGQFRTENVLGEDFSVSAYGTIKSCLADYTFTKDAYKKYINKVDFINIHFNNALSQTSYKKFVSLVSENFGNNTKINAYEGFSKGAFKAQENMLTCAGVLIIAAIFSAMLFVNILLRLQSSDIFIFIICGAKKNKLITYYWLITMLFCIISLSFGVCLFKITLAVDIYNYSNLSGFTTALIGCAFFLCSTAISAFVTVSKTIKMIIKDFKGALA